MAVYGYEIATEGEGVGGLTNVEDLSTGFPPPRGGVVHYLETHYTGEGLSESDGGLAVVWRWDGITQAQYNTLRGYCAGRSAVCYIATRSDDGTYADYKAIVHWPEDPTREKQPGQIFMPFELLFTRLEAQ